MKFSIIIPIFNAEKYLQDALASLLNQSLSFRKNIEIVLVDDGSTDGSAQICKKYVKQFPDNIKYKYTDNSGPGNARNIGLELVKTDTDIIGFMDADDYLSKDTLQKVSSFFKEYTSIQLAVIPLYHFEKTDSPHRLNYRFAKGNRVIDITKEYNAIHFHIGGCFFKAKNFLEDRSLRFNSTLKFWEDALLINTFLLHNQKYGVISGAKYFYRKRADESSLVNSAWHQTARYTHVLKTCYIPIINESIRLYGRIIPYVQFLLIYHMRLYLFPKNNGLIYNVLSEQEQGEFFHEYINILRKFDNRFIIEQDMPYFYKNYLMNLKANGWPYKQTLSPKFNHSVTISKVIFYGTHWRIEGQYISKEYIMKETDRIFLIDKDNKIIYLPNRKLPTNSRTIWGTVVRDQQFSGFTATLPANHYSIQFGLETADTKYLLNKVNLFRTSMGKVRKIFSVKRIKNIIAIVKNGQ
jgi:glycosyltransferase involved in cell wall biosynthesis